MTNARNTQKSKIKFSEFNLPDAVMRAIEKLGFETATEVQSQAIPLVLDGQDVLATAQTGTGKTYAFAIPILTRFLGAAPATKKEIKKAAEGTMPGKALIVAPTRELAEQIGEALRDLTWSARRFRYCVIIGGASYGRQLSDLRNDPWFVVGTPGRLIDHIKSGALDLSDFSTLVLDEADRMLDMGFEPQIEELVENFPPQRQTLMFSATLPPEVRRLVSRYLKNPARISIGEENRPVDLIKQDIIELKENEKEKRLLAEIDKVAGTIIVFTKTKLRADFVARALNQAGHEAGALHGDLTQRQRRSVTEKFRDERIRILVATDIAARGLDISHVRHVINYDLPIVAEDYIHRIGRTGRAGAEGHSIAFVTPAEKRRWFAILKLMGRESEGGGERQRQGRFERGGPRRGDGQRPQKQSFQRHQKPEHKGGSKRPSFGEKSSFGDKKKSGFGEREQSFGKKKQGFGGKTRSFGDESKRQSFGEEKQGFSAKKRGFDEEKQSFGAKKRGFGEDKQSFGAKKQDFGAKARAEGSKTERSERGEKRGFGAPAGKKGRDANRGGGSSSFGAKGGGRKVLGRKSPRKRF